MIESLIKDRIAYTGLSIVSPEYIYEGFPIFFLYIFNLLFKPVYRSYTSY